MIDYVIRPATIQEVRPLFETYHGYASVGRIAVYCFAVIEKDRIVAAYVWQPPPPGAADVICPEAPYAVLSLSRMVAVPREERDLNHVSRPLRYQMKNLIDRGRWPVLVTYSDASLGHTGHVYKCSGWEKTTASTRSYYTDETGSRTSCYSCGGRKTGLIYQGETILQRWEHRVCAPGSGAVWVYDSGWRREKIPGKYWKSGNPAFRWVRKRGQ